jgi:hypothetical protein
MITDEKWIEGDRAAGELIKKVNILVNSKETAEEKIKKLGIELEEACIPWNLKGDDRVLSKMNQAADEAFEKVILDEIVTISATDAFLKKKRLAELLKLVDKSFWLADGFKVSLRLAIAFAKVAK